MVECYPSIYARTCMIRHIVIVNMLTKMYNGLTNVVYELSLGMSLLSITILLVCLRHKLDSRERLKKVLRIFASLKLHPAGRHRIGLLRFPLVSEDDDLDIVWEDADMFAEMLKLPEQTRNDAAAPDLTHLLKKISSSAVVPQFTPNNLQSTRLLRIIIVYTSDQVPELDCTDENVRALLQNSCVVCDVLYIHTEPTDDNNVKDSFAKLCDLDFGRSYIMEVASNVTKLHDHMALLLKHPFLRPPQATPVCHAIMKTEP